jgi:hypothetical protein
MRAAHHIALAAGVITTRPLLCLIAEIAAAATLSVVVASDAGAAGADLWASGSVKVASSGVSTSPGHSAVTPKFAR